MSNEKRNPQGRLQGRTALITGASRGIGYAIARSFASQGANLILNAVGEARLKKVADELKTCDVEVSYFAADLSRQCDVDDLFAFAVQAHPELDVLVNNAGIHLGKAFTEHSMDEFDQLMKINVYAVFQLTQLAIRHMQQLGRGKVINVSSTAGKWESLNQAAYNTSKHAVVGLSKCVALENAGNGINVNTICPGIVDTDLISNAQANMQATADMSEEDFRAAIEGQIPMGRMLQPEEVSNIAIYLASAESDGMTGQTITISGGMRMG